MTAVRPDPAEPVRPQNTGAGWGLMRMVQHWIDARGEGVLVGLMLAAFIVLWLAFQTVSLLPVDLRDDASEAACGRKPSRSATSTRR